MTESIVVMFLLRFYLLLLLVLLEFMLRVLDENSLSGSRVETVRTLVLMLSRRCEVDEENWFLKC